MVQKSRIRVSDLGVASLDAEPHDLNVLQLRGRLLAGFGFAADKAVADKAVAVKAVADKVVADKAVADRQEAAKPVLPQFTLSPMICTSCSSQAACTQFFTLHCSGCVVQDSGFRIQGSGFGIHDFGFPFGGFGFRD